jgi:hypothetical protein
LAIDIFSQQLQGSTVFLIVYSRAFPAYLPSVT